MEIAVQVAMGVGLAACAGLRAWFPLLVLGVLARTGHAEVGPAYRFLASDPALIVLGVATIIELLGDKVPAVDHALDHLGTVARPAAGAVLAASVLTKLDPVAALALGLAAGGLTSLGIHAGKSALRLLSTSTIPLHGGTGNVALSVGEDLVLVAGLLVALLAPVLAFVLAVVALALSIALLRRLAGRRRKAPAGPA